MGQVIHDSGKRLERLIENFLIYAQIELLGADAQKVSALRQKQTLSTAKLIEEHAQDQAQRRQAGGRFGAGPGRPAGADVRGIPGQDRG